MVFFFKKNSELILLNSLLIVKLKLRIHLGSLMKKQILVNIEDKLALFFQDILTSVEKSVVP